MLNGFRIAAAVLLVCVSSASAVTPEQRQADLDWVRLELPRRHLNLFSVNSREVFDAAAAELQRASQEFSDEQFYTGLMKLVASARDAHTALSIPGASLGFTALSITLKIFDDGVFVTGAEQGFAELNGARVLGIQGFSIEDVIARIRPVVSYENEWWFAAQAPNFLANIGVLRGVGVVGSGELPRFSLRLPSGEVREVELAPRTGAVVRAVDSATGFTPVLLRRTDENYWSEYWADSRTLYVAYRRCAEMPWQPIAAFAREISLTLQSNRVDTVVVDLRGNPGGNSVYFEQLVDGVLFALNQATVANPGMRGYGLIDGTVFSSGMLAAAVLLNRFGHNIPLVGEPTGGSPTGYGEALGFTLPGSGIAGQYSTKYFNVLPGQTIEPDIRVPVRSTDYFMRHDPALMVAVTHSTPASETGPVLVPATDPRAQVASVVRLAASGVPAFSDLLNVWVGLQKATVLRVDSEVIEFRLPYDALGQVPVAMVVADQMSNAVMLTVSGSQ
jgi:hypothetical protein